MTYDKAIKYLKKKTGNKVKLNSWRYGIYLTQDLETKEIRRRDTIFQMDDPWSDPCDYLKSSSEWEVYKKKKDKSNLLTRDEKQDIHWDLSMYYINTENYVLLDYLYVQDWDDTEGFISYHFKDGSSKNIKYTKKDGKSKFPSLEQGKHYTLEELCIY